MAKFYRIRCTLPLGVAALVAYPFAALSQAVAPSQVTPQTVVAPSQVTPQSLRPAATSAPGGLLVSGGAGLQAPAGAEGLNVTVGRLTIEGAFPELDSETRTFAKAVEGQRVTVGRIYELANALEQAYARAGYFLARVTVPPQKLNDNGPLQIVVIDGFVEKVQVDNVPDRVRLLVTNRMASLVGRRHVKLGEIERCLLIAGDVPGLRLKSTLARGETPGGALLVLEGTHQLVTGTGTIDNHLPSVLGTWSYGGSAALNSPFGFGEQFYASALSAGELARTFDPDAPLRVLGVGIVLPLGLDGWILNPEYTYSRSVPVPVNGGLDNIGHFQRLGLRSSYSPIRTRTQTLTLTGAYEYITQNVALPLFATDLNRDRYGVLRAGAAYETALPWLSETLQTSATYSHGTGGRDAADAAASGIPLSRQGAGPLFAKATVDGRLIQPLPEAFRFDLIGRAQTSFGQPMLISEQFFLDGAQAVSAYPMSSLAVDEGGTLRGELSRSFGVPGPVPLTMSPYGFGVSGIGRLVDPTVVEVVEVVAVRAASFGAGVRSNIDMPDGYQGLSVGLEAARQYSNLPNLAQSWRINVSMSSRF
jgi:hemolysin activation/secretion protein